MTALTIDENRVVRDISPDDGMYVAGDEHYYGVGRAAVECIGCALQAARVPAAGVRRVLDLPCGYGRVLRFLRAAFPDAEITACDLLRDSVDFCAATFGAVPVYSAADPAAIPVGRDAFDLIWVGSLLTHLDAPRWAAFLEFFRRALRPGGVLVFSAHGRVAYDWTVRRAFDYGLPDRRATAVRYRYERKGFGYAPYPSDGGYGMSLSHPSWVLGQVAQVNELRVVHFAEGAWYGHHDVYGCVRDPDWHVSHPPVSAFKYLKHKIRERVRR